MSGLPEAVLLFGAGGFIGRNIIDALMGKVGRLIGVTASGKPISGCDLTIGADHLDAIPVLPHDAILINVAAARYDPRSFRADQSLILQRNLAILTGVYRFCVDRGIAEVRQASSSAVYPAGLDPQDDDEPLDLTRAPNEGELGYAWSRRMAEIIAETHHRLYGINTQSFRLTNPYGAYDTSDEQCAHLATALVIRVLKEQGPLRLLGNPGAERDFVFAGDVARIFVESCRRRGVNDVMNLAYGEVTTIRQFAETLLDVTGSDKTIEIADTLPTGVNRRRATGRRLRHSFPEIRLRPLTEGLRETILWYRHELDR